MSKFIYAESKKLYKVTSKHFEDKTFMGMIMSTGVNFQECWQIECGSIKALTIQVGSHTVQYGMSRSRKFGSTCPFLMKHWNHPAHSS